MSAQQLSRVHVQPYGNELEACQLPSATICHVFSQALTEAHTQMIFLLQHPYLVPLQPIISLAEPLLTRLPTPAVRCCAVDTL